MQSRVTVQPQAENMMRGTSHIFSARMDKTPALHTKPRRDIEQAAQREQRQTRRAKNKKADIPTRSVPKLSSNYFCLAKKITCTTADKKYAIKWPLRRSSSTVMATRFKAAKRANRKQRTAVAKGIGEEIGD